jgi:hypothetical protein
MQEEVGSDEFMELFLNLPRATERNYGKAGLLFII